MPKKTNCLCCNGSGQRSTVTYLYAGGKVIPTWTYVKCYSCDGIGGKTEYTKEEHDISSNGMQLIVNSIIGLFNYVKSWFSGKN